MTYSRPRGNPEQTPRLNPLGVRAYVVRTQREDRAPGKIYTVLIIFPLMEHFWHIDRMRWYPAKQVKALDFGLWFAIVYA